MDLLFCVYLLRLRENIASENIGVCRRSKKTQIHFTYIYELSNVILLHCKIELVVATYSGTI